MGLSGSGGGPAWLAVRNLDSREESTPGAAQDEQGIGIVSFLAAFLVAVIVFAIQATLFMLLRNKLARIL